MIPHAIIAHKSRGRLRIRVPEKKGQTAYWQQVLDSLKEIDGIKSLSANPVTAGVLILHELPEKEILGYAHSLGLFKVPASQLKVVPLQYKVTRSFRSMNRSIKRFTGDELDLGSVTFLGLLTIGGYEIAKGNFTAPAWYTAFWYALNIFMKNQPADTPDDAAVDVDVEAE
ncbi:MAG TPA: hypothetical protein VK445_01000 [Dissulfurispiraceae bacterium]|nr:hypothetical protein [Dissulfurispiraceae bacterium]